MQMLFEFFPIIVFFSVYKLFGIYSATAAAIIISLIQNLTYIFRNKKIEKMRFTTLIIVILLGGATLILHNPVFIKWKPSVVYWIFAGIFLGSQLFGKKPIIRIMMEGKIEMVDHAWAKINFSWGIFFLIMGALNLYVAHTFSTNFWVNFKLFGILGLTILFVIIQAVYLAKHIPES